MLYFSFPFSLVLWIVQMAWVAHSAKKPCIEAAFLKKGNFLFRWYLYFRQNYIKFENFFNIFDKTDLFVIMSGLKSWTGESPKSEGRKEIQTMHCRLVEEGRVKVKIDTDKERYYKYIL